MFRPHVVIAIFSRNFKQYFTSILGYLFIFVFVTLCAILTFSNQFFVDNLANLDQLSRYFPVLLLFLIPAITMTVWADEKKQGTDAILFTLPASDLEILAGKYLSVVAVYTVALLFSGTQLIALAALGSPDWGVIATTYLGYWLAGVALLAIGMFASSLTSSNTVAFVIGATLCAIPVMFGYLFEGDRFLESLGIGPQLRDFRLGLVSLPGVVYFLSIALFMLYLNLVVIGKRHWSRGQSISLSGHFAIRIASLATILVAVTFLADRSSAMFQNRLDLTSEQLYTLDQTTRDTIVAAAANNRPVDIQAFISPDVPQQFVSTRKRLIGLLRQYDRLGGNNIDVRLVEVNPNSDQIDEAQSLGIVPHASRDTVAGKVVEQNVYMGAVITSTLDEVILPFIDGDTSIEYELTRSIATTTDEARKLKIGILKTDAHFNNLRVQGRIYDWSSPGTIEELEKQYELVDVEASELPTLMKPESAENGTDQTTEPPDVLIVVDPSSLTLSGMFNLIEWIDAGNPVLIMADPLPFYPLTYYQPSDKGIINAPAQPRINPQAGWAPVATSTEPKALNGTAATLMGRLGITWKHDRAVWSVNNPHLSFKPVFPEWLGRRWPDRYGPRDAALLFAKSSAGFEVFNSEHPVSRGLQEVLFVYGGSIAPIENAKTNFQPLITLKPGSAGHYDWDELTEDLITTRQEMNRFTGEITEVTGPVVSRDTGHNTRVLRPVPKLARNRVEKAEPETNDPAETETTESAIDQDTMVRTKLDEFAHVLAAHITGGDKPVNVLFVADADFASDMVEIQQPELDSPLDNFTFLVNAIETLAGDETFVRLRNRRATPRTLTAIESATEPYRIQAAVEQDRVDADIDQKLTDAQTAVDRAADRIQQDQEMSVLQKIQETGLSMASENRKFEKQREKLERQREKKTAKIETEKQQQISAVESQIRRLAIGSAGLPALFLGSLVLVVRTMREQKNIDPQRRVNNAAA